MGPGISVSEALASKLAGPLLVRGWILSRNGESRLCNFLTDSLPPQCGEPSLIVQGLDIATVAGVRSEGDTVWSSEPALLLGDVKGKTLTVGARSKG